MSRRIETELRRTGGARVVRVSDAAGVRVAEHAHDWPVISTFVIGEYRNECALGAARVALPSALYYRAGESHANEIGPEGLEQLDIEFDPAWLGPADVDELGSVRRWVGGPVAAAARSLARIWVNGAPEDQLRRATRAFVRTACATSDRARPAWVDRARARLSSPTPPSTRQIAGELGLHPAWLAQAYRAAVGEGVADTVRRRRVERAAHLLRVSDASLAAVAADVGFCDQSHMNRAFRALLGRTPLQVRAEWAAAGAGRGAATTTRPA